MIRIESRRRERKIRKRNPFLNPPLKRRAIIVCPFKGAFDNSPAFQGWEKEFRGFRAFSCFRDSKTQQKSIDLE